MKYAVFCFAFVAVASGCGPKKFTVPDSGIVSSDDVELVARGEYLFHGAAHCSACHTTAEVGASIKGGDRPAPSGGHEWKMGPLGTLRSANITSDAKTGIGTWSDADIARVIKHGVRPDGTISTFMRFALGDIADDDIRALVSYVRTLAPVENAVPRSEIGLLGGMVLGGLEPRTSQAPTTAPPLAPTVERGRYLAYGPAACVNCHSATDGFAPKKGMEFTGATEPMESEFEDDANKYLAPNLTPDPTGIAGKWTEEQFLARFKEGRTHRGSPMPWGNYQNLQDDDVKALWLFLKSLPPHAHDTSVTVIAKK